MFCIVLNRLYLCSIKVNQLKQLKIKVMKTQTTLLMEMSKTALQNLTYQVKETLALPDANKKTFSAADLWNIQRRHISSVQRRRFV